MKRALAQSAALLVAIGASLVGQNLLPREEWVGMGIAYFVVGIFALLFALLGRPAAHGLDSPYTAVPDEPLVPLFNGTRVQRMALAATTAVAAGFAFAYLGGNRFTLEGVIMWLAALAGFLCLFWEVPAGWAGRMYARWREKRSFFPITPSWKITRSHLLLLLIFLVAAFFRFYRLAELPGEMTSDHAEKLLDVYDVLTGQRPIFFPRNTGREAMQFYLTAAIIRLGGLEVNYLPLKIGTALVGLLSVPLVYLLVRELYGRSAALIATALFALSSWHVAITRVGLRFPFTAAFATPTLYFLFRAFKYGRRNDWLAAGLVLGVGLHTYIPMRMVPPLLVLLALIKLLLDWYRQRRRRPLPIPPQPDTFPEASALTRHFWESAVLGGIASLLVFLPLLRYMWDEPEMFWFRVTSRSLQANGRLPLESWRIFWNNVKNGLLMFNYKGDPVVTNSIPHTPFLGVVSGGLFLLGIVYLLWRLFRHGDRRTIYLLVTLFMLMLPSILSLEFPQENPSRVRAGGAIPIAMMIAALPPALLWQQLRQQWRRIGGWLAAAVTAVLFALAVRDNYTYYFIDYDQHVHRSLWNTCEIGEVARGFAHSMGDLEHVYHVPFPYWIDTRLVAICAGDITWHNDVPNLKDEIAVHAIDPAPKLYILHPQDQVGRITLTDRYPHGWVEQYYSKIPAGKDFMLFYVPPRE